MGELLALASAVCFGSSHFLSGFFARRVGGLTVAFTAQIAGTGLSLLLVPFDTSVHTGLAALAWGALSGLGTGIGVGFLFRAMGNGPMSVVVPLSDVGAVTLPVLVGLLFLGERPSGPALAGIVLALPAIWLVSRGDGVRAGFRVPGTADALIAGLGFATHFLALARIPVEAGLWPVVVSRAVSVLVLAPMVVATRSSPTVKGKPLAGIIVSGSLGTLATVLYLWASHRQLMSVATVLSALYPAIPVVLGLVLLAEKVNRRQVVGLLCAGAAIGLIAVAK